MTILSISISSPDQEAEAALTAAPSRRNCRALRLGELALGGFQARSQPVQPGATAGVSRLLFQHEPRIARRSAC
jgi:hypothetical protein